MLKDDMGKSIISISIGLGVCKKSIASISINTINYKSMISLSGSYSDFVR